ncbi:MAG: DUF2281 domain-containing protein [Chitinophagaceae bacterium]
MDNAIFVNRLEVLPEHMKSEVLDFIDFLISKATREQKTEIEPKPKFGSGKGMFIMHKGFDEPLDAFKEYMEK